MAARGFFVFNCEQPSIGQDVLMRTGDYFSPSIHPLCPLDYQLHFVGPSGRKERYADTFTSAEIL